MLLNLYIKNFAIISEQSVDFVPELNIITGETGAGKSILLSAIELILGRRAQSQLLRNEEEKCIIEATFDLSDSDVQDMFDTFDLDYDDRTIIRREILPSGKSRAFVNDTPCRLDTLQELGKQLLHLHQQFDSQSIGEADFQYQVIDAWAEQKPQIETYQAKYKAYRKDQNTLKELERAQIESNQRKDYLEFQVKELDELDLQEGESETLEARRKRETALQEIKLYFSNIALALTENERSVSNILSDLWREGGSLVGLDSDVKEFQQRLDAIITEIDDLGNSASQLSDNLEYDPETVNQTEERLDQINKLLSKYQVRESNELLEILDDFLSELKTHSQSAGDLANLRASIDIQHQELLKAAELIRQGRKKGIPSFNKKVKEKLSYLGMAKANFEVVLQPLDELGRNGLDQIQFLFSANPGIPAQPIKQVASGGEISRLALILKSLVASILPLPTIVFDEIDTGVSGDIAGKMGDVLDELSKGHQTIVITHSPQIAVKGDHHLFVSKSQDDKETKTDVILLGKAERIAKVAIMLSSDPPTKTALTHAEELMKNLS